MTAPPSPMPEKPVPAIGVRSGLAWSLSARFGTQAVSFGVTVLLARILTPSDFGVVGMLIVFSGFAQLIADAGLGSALIYKQDLTESDLSTVFWVQLSGGALMTLLFFFGAPLFAGFFNTPALAGLYRVFAFVFLIQSLGIVQATMLRREGRFRYLAMVVTIGTLLSGTTAVFLALQGYGVWALLAQLVIMTSVTSLLYWIGGKWVPRLIFDPAAIRELGGYGIFLLGHSTLNYWLRNGDNLLIGRFLGSGPLGLYTRAYGLMLLPVSNISNVFGQVMFPALSRVQNDREAFVRLYLKAVRTIALVAFPVMTGMWLLSRQIVLLLYGDKWVGMIPLLEVLSLLGIVQSIVFPVGWIYTSLGRTRDQFMLSIVLLIAFAAAMALGLSHGLYGVTIAYAVWTVFAAISNIHVANRILDLKPFAMVSVTLRILIATLLLAAVVGLGDRLLWSGFPLLLNIILNVGIGGLVYLLAILLLKEPAALEALTMVRRRRPG